MLGRQLILWRKSRFGGIYVSSASAIQLSLATLKGEWLVTKSSDAHKNAPSAYRTAMPRSATDLGGDVPRPRESSARRCGDSNRLIRPLFPRHPSPFIPNTSLSVHGGGRKNGRRFESKADKPAKTRETARENTQGPGCAGDIPHYSN